MRPRKAYVILEPSPDYTNWESAYIARFPCHNAGVICLEFPSYTAALHYFLSGEF